MTDNPLVRGYSDAAKRVSDAISLHLAADPDGSYGKYMAFKLRDGENDGVRYDNRNEAIRHQRSMDRYMYIQIRPGGLLPQHAERLLRAFRMMDDKGYRIPHPEDSLEIDMPGRLEEWKPSGLILPTVPRPRNARTIWRG